MIYTWNESRNNGWLTDEVNTMIRFLKIREIELFQFFGRTLLDLFVSNNTRNKAIVFWKDILAKLTCKNLYNLLKSVKIRKISVKFTLNI